MSKGLVLEDLLKLGGAGFNGAYTTTKASAPCMEAGRDNFTKGLCLPGS